jgi:hypothetical protein
VLNSVFEDFPPSVDMPEIAKTQAHMEHLG